LTSKETDDKLTDWTSLLSTISHVAYLAIVMLHTNFQQCHYPDKKHDVAKSALLQKTFFKIKSQLKLNSSPSNLQEPLLSNTNRDASESSQLTTPTI
jgi:hypothetical protein